jgi:peptidyl-prolyl cis-trans isomerase SurA
MMKHLGFILLLPALILSCRVSAQIDDKEVLMTIDGQKVTVGEFLNIYNKNNVQTEVADQKSMDEYLDLFINFKLKVRDAEMAGLDTVKSLREELAGYRKQLTPPYFVDKETLDMLVKEAWERMQYDLRASHILVRVAPMASAADTLAAYKKIQTALERARKGEDFGKLALELSEDPSARNREATSQRPFLRGNKGDLGFFTVFNMIYPFENAAYKTPKGQVSDIIRTNYGYHIIKVFERRPALGRAQVAHIFFQIPANARAEDSLRIKMRADSVYQRYLAGEDFTKLVKEFSDDKGSAARDGVLPWFTCNRLVPEFMEVVYNLKPGDVSKPVLTPYGWHIIKMIDHKPIGSFESEEENLRQRLEKDSRYSFTKSNLIAKLKKEYAFRENTKALADLLPLLDTNIYHAKWTVPSSKKLKKVLFTLAGQKYTLNDFANWLSKNQKKMQKADLGMYLKTKYKEYVDEQVVAYEDSRLETKYPDFGLLMKEYHDGILLFEITQKKVWDKAIQDTTGLLAFYESVKNNYMWPDRKEITRVQIRNIKDPKKADLLAKQVVEWINFADMTLTTMKEKILENDSTLIVDIERDKVAAGEESLADELTQPQSYSRKDETDESGRISLRIVVLNRLLPPMPKELDEVRGHVTAEYQNYLESEWIKNLREKYPVVVNREVFEKIKNQ